MANQATTFSELINSIPEIHVIPPTPDNGPSRVGTTTEPSSKTLWQQDNEKFKDPECEICEQESEKKPTEVIMNVDAQIPVGPCDHQTNEDDDFFQNMAVENCLERCMRFMASFNESKFMLVFQFLLLSIPVSAGFMGAKYLDKCPLSSETPVFLFMMGIAGTIVIICRILLIAQKIMLPTHREWQVLRVIVIVGNLAIIVCLATEMFSFFRTTPSFEVGSAHYCHERFYIYTYWVNWTCLLVMTILLVLQLPNCTIVAMQNDETL